MLLRAQSGLRTFLCGAASGATQGSLGVGGGILMVNGLTRFNGMRQAQAVGTGLPTQIFTNTIGGATFAAAGLVDPLAAVTLGSASILGAMGGVRLGSRMNEEESRGVMGAFMVALSPLMALGPLLRRHDDEDDDGGGGGDVDNSGRLREAASLLSAATSAAPTGDDDAETRIEAGAEHWTVRWQPKRLWEDARARGPVAVGQLLGLGTLVGVCQNHT